MRCLLVSTTVVIAMVSASCSSESSPATEAVVASTTSDATVATPTASATAETTSDSTIVETTSGMDIPEGIDPNDWIVYQGYLGGGANEAIVLIHPDGTGAHEIDDDIDGYGQVPDWSPDGTKVAMSPRGPSPEPLYEYDLQTETAEILFDCFDPCIGDDEPHYSADGTKIAFIRALGPFVGGVPSICGLWIGDLATREVEQITANEGCDREFVPRWSPDGTQIAYTRWNGSDGTAIFVIDAEGGAEAQLTDWELVASYADWSPDGQWIVFSTQPFLLNNDDGPISNLYRMRPDGSGVEPLTFYDAPNPRPNQPRYSPDGQWIVFTMDTGPDREIWVMPADGGEPLALITGGIHTHPAWQPHG